MYWSPNDPTTPTDPFEPSSGENLKGLRYAFEVEKAFAQAFSIGRIEKFYLTLESDVKKLNTQIGNGLASNLKNIENTIFNVYEEGLQYGFAYGDAKEFIGEIGEGLQRTVKFQKDNVIESLALAKAMGMTGKEVATMVKDLMVMGMGPEKANQILTNTFTKARLYGVDASKLTATVSKNILQAQAYGFKGGVDGLTKMAIQAQRLGIDLEKTMNAAEGLLDPEKAIEAASSMQMLGGAVGALADPFQLMHLAQSDVGELQNQIGQTTAKMVKFNSATGDFKIDPAMRRDMTQLAQSLGMDYKTVADMAIKFRKEQEIASKIPIFGSMSEEEKSMITSMSEIKGGKVMVHIPGTDQIKEASTLVAADLEKLRQEQKEVKAMDDPKYMKQVAKDQLTVQEKMALSLEQIRNAGIFGFKGKEGDLTGKLEGMTTAAQMEQLKTNLKEGIRDTLSPQIVDLYATQATNFTDYVTQQMGKITATIQNMITAMSNTNFTPTPSAPTPTEAYDIYIPAGTNKTISTGFGDLINLNKGDASLNIPQEDMETLFNYANLGDKMSKMVPNSKMTESKVGTLTNYIEQKIVTETTSKQEVNVGGSADINIKIDSNIPQNMLDKIIDNPELKRTIMSQINERLSKSFKEKLINPLT
jgi:hypothetical protein